jgi:hypothetical protein
MKLTIFNSEFNVIFVVDGVVVHKEMYRDAVLEKESTIGCGKILGQKCFETEPNHPEKARWPHPVGTMKPPKTDEP